MIVPRGRIGKLEWPNPGFNWPFFFLLYFMPVLLNGQGICLGDEANRLYRYDPAICQVKPWFDLDIAGKLGGLSFDASGNLYALNSEGKLYKVDTVKRSATLHYSFLNLQTFNALCSGPEDILYVTGSEGFVYSYNLSTQAERYLGDLGHVPTGGMVFFEQDLLVMLRNGQMLKVDSRDFNRKQIIKFDLNKDLRTLFTAPFVSGDCERLNTFGSAVDGSIFQINRITGLVIPHCHLMVSFTAAASTYDLHPDQPLNINACEIIPSDCDEDNGQIVVHASGGMGLIRYSAGGPLFTPDSVLNRIGPGKLTVLIKDENHCLDSAGIIMTERKKPEMEQIQVVDAGCLRSGKITVTPKGGQGPLQYSLDGAVFQFSASYEAVMAGNHSLVARDTHGCADTTRVLVGEISGVTLSKLMVSAAVCMEANGRLSIFLDDPGTGVKYAVDGGPDQSNPVFEGLGSGAHRVSIRDEEGCSLDTLVMVGSEACPVYIPNVFTPNGDGKNDVFQVFSSSQDLKVRNYLVFDRWGNLVYEAKGFMLSASDYWWNGTDKGEAPSPGVYAYRIVLEFKGHRIQTFQGSVTLVL